MLEFEAHFIGGVAAEVLIGQEQYYRFWVLPPEGFKDSPAVAGGAAISAVVAAEGLDGGGAVDICYRDEFFGMGEVFVEEVKALFDLFEVGHFRQAAAGVEVGQEHFLVVFGEDVGGLGHEKHPAENDEFGIFLLGAYLAEFETVAGEVGELNDLIPLIMMTQDDYSVGQFPLALGDQLQGIVLRKLPVFDW